MRSPSLAAWLKCGTRDNPFNANDEKRAPLRLPGSLSITVSVSYRDEKKESTEEL